jgi:hypothetical protein
MDEAIGTIVIISIAGVIFGDEVCRKIAVWMLLGSLALAFIFSPTFAVALVLAPFAIGIMVVGGLIAFIRKL